MVKNILSKEIVERIDLSDFEYQNIIKELVSPLDLLWAGKYMHNCLRGYNENGFNLRIERGEIRIFVISDDTERSALQISKTYSNTYKIDQLYGHSNSNVCVKHKMIADYLISFLEYKHYLLESQKIIENFKNNKDSFLTDISNSSYEKYDPIPTRRANRQNIFAGLEPIYPIIEAPIALNGNDFVDMPVNLGFTVTQIDDRDIVQYHNDEDIDVDF